jgi:hypothetical protein
LHEPGLAWVSITLLVIGGLNTVFSAVYYLKVLRVMVLEGRAEDLEGVEPKQVQQKLPPAFFAGLLALTTLALGVVFGPLLDLSRVGVERYLPKPPTVAAEQTTAPAGGLKGPPAPPPVPPPPPDRGPGENRR